MSQPKISVAIPVRNEADKIGQCLEAVFSQSLKPHEVIIVDGHSTDGTVEKVTKFPIKLFYEDAHSESRIGRGRQIGVEKAEGEYIAFTDADCIPDRNWLEGLVGEFEQGIVGVGGGMRSVGKGLWERSVNLVFSTFLGSATSVQGRFFKTKRFVRSISACNSMYRREDVLMVGGINADLPGAEDRELNKRLSKLGNLLYTPKAVVLHQHSWTPTKFVGKVYGYGEQRGMIRIWDLQVVPPLILPFLGLSLIFTPWFLVAMVGLYLALIESMGIRFAAKERDWRFLFSIPTVYVIEHGLYTIGFWKGILFSYKTRLNR